MTVTDTDPTVAPTSTYIMLQNMDGQLTFWQTNGANGTTVSDHGSVGPDPGPNCFEKGTGAFFSGDTSDILLQAQTARSPFGKSSLSARVVRLGR
jgi:hypothetical protein